MKKFMLYSAALIGTYIVVANATGFGRAFNAVSSGVTGYAKTLQGR